MSSLARLPKGASPEGDVELVELAIETGSGKTPKATIRLKDAQGWMWDDVAMGNGPIDVAVKAIDRRLGLEGKVRLAGLSIVSKYGEEGSESVAQATVKVSLSHKGDNGLETSETTAKAEDPDLVKATVLAYVVAINILRKATEAKA